jgi:transposase
VLAELAKGRLRAKLPQLRQALRGRFGDHHALLVRLALAHLEHLEASIAELDVQVDRVLAPFTQARDQLDTITGVGEASRRDDPGRDWDRHDGVPHRWPSGLLGRTLPGQQPHRRQASLGKPTKGNRWLGEMLTGCAWAAARSRDSYLSAQF